MFETDIPLVSIICGGIALLMAVAAIVFGLRPLRLTARDRDSDGLPAEAGCDEESGGQSEAKVLPRVSVITYAKADRELTERFLDSLMRQDYPDFEVIVVFDASPETADMLTEELAGKYPAVHFTFIPTESHNLSRPKLAVTVGIKAATGTVVVTTASNAVIPSARWISGLAAPFAGDNATEVVLGYSHLDFSGMSGPGKWYRQFDSVMTSAQWIGAAAAGHPYRGDRYNLAFLRDTFYRNKGYAHSIYLHNGDDDLFVDEISRGDNTALVLSPATMLTMDWGDSADRVWSMRKDAYGFTARWLPRRPFVRAGLTSAAQWGVPALCVAAALTALPSVIPAIACGMMLLAFWGIEIATYRRTAARLDAVRLWWAVVPFMMLRPVVNCIFKARHHSHRVKNYTWQR